MPAADRARHPDNSLERKYGDATPRSVVVSNRMVGEPRHHDKQQGQQDDHRDPMPADQLSFMVIRRSQSAVYSFKSRSRMIRDCSRLTCSL